MWGDAWTEARATVLDELAAALGDAELEAEGAATKDAGHAATLPGATAPEGAATEDAPLDAGAAFGLAFGFGATVLDGCTLLLRPRQFPIDSWPIMAGFGRSHEGG